MRTIDTLDLLTPIMDASAGLDIDTEIERLRVESIHRAMDLWCTSEAKRLSVLAQVDSRSQVAVVEYIVSIPSIVAQAQVAVCS
jgi:hypothetical protein